MVIAAVAQQLGLDDSTPGPVAERLAAALRDKRVLVLLDNFEHLIAARTDLLALLTAAPGVTALVTSRVPLRVRGEREYRIAPLEVPRAGTEDLGDAPASALFVDRARAVGVELSPDEGPAVAEICRRLEGLPLAISAPHWTGHWRTETPLRRCDSAARSGGSGSNRATSAKD